MRIGNILLLAFDYVCTYFQQLFHKHKSEQEGLINMTMPEPVFDDED